MRNVPAGSAMTKPNEEDAGSLTEPSARAKDFDPTDLQALREVVERLEAVSGADPYVAQALSHLFIMLCDERNSRRRGRRVEVLTWQLAGLAITLFDQHGAPTVKDAVAAACGERPYSKRDTKFHAKVARAYRSLRSGHAWGNEVVVTIPISSQSLKAAINRLSSAKRSNRGA